MDPSVHGHDGRQQLSPALNETHMELPMTEMDAEGCYEPEICGSTSMELLSNELEDRSFLSQCTWGGCCIVVLACLVTVFRNWSMATVGTRGPVVLDRGNRQQTLRGWGTSLCWMGNAIGRWENETLRSEVMDFLFDPDKGLAMNVVRYNIGGGESQKHHHFLRPGADVQGWLSANGTWDWNADLTQRWVLRAAVHRGVNLIEAFSNSPPYWMTQSGSATGSRDGRNNLKDEMYAPFAEYLVNVVQGTFEHRSRWPRGVECRAYY